MSKFDGDLQVGDIVISPHKNRGFWRVIEIEDRFSNTYQNASYIHVELVMSEDGVLPKKKARTHQFFAYQISKVDEEKIENWRSHDEAKWKHLLEVVRVKTPEELAEELIKNGEDIPDPDILSFYGPPPSLVKE